MTETAEAKPPKPPPSWLVDSPSYDIQKLELPVLIQLWKKHRNDPMSIMAANEVCRRLAVQMRFM